MYKLIEYYVEKDIVKYHIVDTAETREEIDKKKSDIAIILKNTEIRALEVVATKNINSLQKLLKEENTKIFCVLKE